MNVVNKVDTNKPLSDSFVSLNSLYSCVRFKLKNRPFIDGVPDNPGHPIMRKKL